MRNVTKVVLLACTALTALALASCEVIASTAGQDISGETVWVSLTPTKPTADGEGKRTATLTLDFSREISGLTSETSAEDLAKIFAFAFDPPDVEADFELTGVEKVAVALYRLKVVNVPLSGIATVTVNRPGITPSTRLWSVDGRMIPDNELPMIASFCFTQSENPSLSEPEAVGSIDQTAGKIVVVAPEGTSLSALIPTVSTSTGSDFSPKGAQDFSQSPVTYTVQSATTGALRDYEVRVIEQKSNSASIEMFQFLAANNSANLTEDVSGIITGSSITVSVPYGTALGALIPTIQYVGASISPANLAAQNFGSPVQWTVTAADSTTQADYWVTVAVNDWASAPSIALTPGNGELSYTITPSNPVADSYDVYWIAGDQTAAATIKSGGTQIPNSPLTGTISSLTNWQIYSVIITAHKTGYADSDSESASEMPVLTLSNVARRFVKVGGNGNGSGTSWENASGNIQAMMDEMEQSAGGEVWVAAGKYTPGSTRESAFALKNNVKVYGGFPAGITTDTPLARAMSDRNACFNTDGAVKDAACETILSGDIDNNDSYELSTGFLTTNYSGNAYHVVTGANAVLDGFTVKGGYADGTDYGTGKGGGIYNSDGSLTLSNLTITGNSAISNEYSESGYGGGIFNRGSSGKLILTNATIAGNKVDGVEYNFGGGMAVIYGTVILTNVTIAGNKADGANGSIGGGIYNYGSGSSLVLTNVAITGNTASGGGGGIQSSNNAYTTLTNVTIAGNRAPTGGGISLDDDTTGHIRNSIVWGNTSSDGGAQVFIYSSRPTTWSHSLVAGSGGSSGPWNTDFGTDDGNNIDSAADPFVSSVPASSAPTKAGNYRLGGTVGVNAGNNAPTVPNGWLADLMGDWTTYYNSLTDLDGLTRKMNGTVDMGAYEKQ